MTIAGPLLAEDQDRPYEYRTYKVGDRVRMRLSPECPYYAVKRDVNASQEGTSDSHPLEVNGAVGVVSVIRNFDHGIRVMYASKIPVADPSLWMYGETWAGGDFASSELELLSSEATR